MSAQDVIDGRAEWSVDVGDVRDWVWSLPKNSVHCWVTSPPYYGLRDYETEGQIGLEKTPSEYVETMVELFRGVRRAMHPTGTLWLNLGDSFGGGNRKTQVPQSVSGGDMRDVPKGSRVQGYDKNLLGIPWRVAFALQDDGWYLRQWCPWVKRNPMPESVDDRPGTGCETVFLLTKEPHYYFDMEAVRKKAASEPHAPVGDEDGSRNYRSSDLWFESVGMLLAGEELLGFDVTTKPFKGAHFAVFPPKLVLPMILAGTSEKGVCPVCGNPWIRQLEKERIPTRPGRDTKIPLQSTKSTLVSVAGNRDPERHITHFRTLGWAPSCSCMTDPDKDGLCGPPKSVPAVVGDVFTGSGTTLMVARDRGRRGIGCELNESYAQMARKRIGDSTPGLF